MTFQRRAEDTNEAWRNVRNLGFGEADNNIYLGGAHLHSRAISCSRLVDALRRHIVLAIRFRSLAVRSRRRSCFASVKRTLVERFATLAELGKSAM